MRYRMPQFWPAVLMMAFLTSGCGSDGEKLSGHDVSDNPVSFQPTDGELQAIARQLSEQTIADEDYQRLLLLEEGARLELRRHLLQRMTEEAIASSAQIYAIVGPSAGWSISADSVNGGTRPLAVKPGQSIAWTLYVEVPFYSQRDIRWEGEPLGYNYDGTSRIGRLGCHLCCVSMLYAKWGYQQMTPLGLNNWSYNGRAHYAFSTAGNGDFIAMSQALQYPSVCRLWSYITSGQIQAHLQAGHPVIAKLNRVGGGNHFVVIFAKQGNVYWVKDPYQSSANQNQPLSLNIADFRVYGY